MFTLEICVDSVASAEAAQRGGADRVELCSDLAEGGITPSSGLVELVRKRLQIALFVMVRPRGGNFCPSDDEFAVMQADVRHAQALGVDGIVLGLLDSGGAVDVARTRQLVELAAPLPVTFHRAIDAAMSNHARGSIESVIATGAARVLTSGGGRSILEYPEKVADMVRRARERITVVACGRLDAGNARRAAETTGASEFHAALNPKTPAPQGTASSPGTAPATADNQFGPNPYIVREADVRALRDQLDRIAAERAASATTPR